MEIRVVWRNARAAVVELDDGGLFETYFSWEVYVNGQRQGTTKKVETYVDGLIPATRNLIRFVCGEEVYEVGVTTPAESATIDVRDCGARGDGTHDDTTNIQAAIMACPEMGRVLVPQGRYVVKSLFLKSGVSVELQEGPRFLPAMTKIPSPISRVPSRERRAWGATPRGSSRSAAGRERA
jgi:polygalacturonase